MARKLETNRIIHGDCLEVMKDWPDNCVDLVLTDPPYNCDVNYDSYKDNLKPTDYDQFIRDFIDLAGTRSRAGLVIVLGSQTVRQWWLHLPDAKQIIVKMGAITFNKSKNLHLQYRPVLTTAKSNIFGLDLWEHIRWPTEGYYFNEERYDHPAMTPLSLAVKCLEHFALPGTTIYDPFSGVGTICVAAKSLGLNYFGTELSEKYCEIARMRLEAVETGVPVAEQKAGQMPLFESK